MNKKRVAITGANGTIGSWLCRVLSSEFEVYAYVGEESNLIKLSGITEINIRKISTFQRSSTFFEQDKPEVLILADWWGVGNLDRESINQASNLIRHQETAKAALESGCKIVMGIGSQAELGVSLIEMSENSPDNPLTQYAKVKVRTRETLEKLCQEYDQRFYWARVFSTYGQIDLGNWLIPNMITSFKRNQEFSMTSGKQVWSYIHLYDLASAINAILTSLPDKSIINIADRKTVRIIEVATCIAEIMQSKNLLNIDTVKKRTDTTESMIPITETLDGIGWSPTISLENGLSDTIDWFQGKKIFRYGEAKGGITNYKIPSYEDMTR